MDKQPDVEQVPCCLSFDYSPLDAKVAIKARTVAARIREKVKRTIGDIIDIGRDLLLIRDALEHGQFGRWLQAEFGWTDRTARNFMAVAEAFGKTEIISELHIQPTAAYLLAAPSTPDDARQAAIERAAAGEPITIAVAKDIVTRAKKKARKRSVSVPTDDMKRRLFRMLRQFQARLSPRALPELVVYLREFAQELEEVTRTTKLAGQRSDRNGD